MSGPLQTCSKSDRQELFDNGESYCSYRFYMSKDTFDITVDIIMMLVQYVKELVDTAELKNLTKGKYENDTQLR